MDGGPNKKCKPNPKEKASIFSIASFWYVLPIIIDGYKRTLCENDLYEVVSDAESSTLGDRLENSWRNEVENAMKTRSKPSLKMALFKIFWLEMLFHSVYVIVCDAIWFTQSVFLDNFLRFYEPEQTIISEKMAYLNAGGIILCSLMNSLMMHHFFFNMLHIGLKARVACCSLIYRKSLKLSKTSLNKVTAGHILNLVSNDSNKMNSYYLHWQYQWLVPLQCIITASLGFLFVDYSVFIGVSIVLSFIIVCDERVRLTNEVISHMKIIKMYSWEKAISDLINKARWSEMNCIRRLSYTYGFLSSFAMFNMRLAMFGIILAYVFSGHSIARGEIFVSFAILNPLRYTMTWTFSQAMAGVAEGEIFLKRMKSFLVLDESNTHKQSNECLSREITEQENRQMIIDMYKIRARWTSDMSEDTLKNISLKQRSGEFVGVIGPVGSGKSNLLQVILKELPICSGFLEINGRLSYASQEPWLFAGTVRQNIIFGLPLDEDRYRQVVRVCALERDLELLPYGDKTIVSETGSSLSGGQQTRINLARAIYREADIYLLDDPLSSLDVSVANHIFEQCMRGFLSEKAVILCMSHPDRLQEVDHILYLENGQIVLKGIYEEINYQLEENMKSLLLNSGRDSAFERNNLATTFSSDKYASFQNGQNQSSHREKISEGSIGIKVYCEYFSDAGYCLVATVLLLFLLTQIFAGLCDYFIAYWVNQEATSLRKHEYTENFPNTIISNHSDVQKTEYLPQQNDSWVFSRYTFSTYYVSICGILILSSILRSILYYYACTKASQRLHKNMLSNVMKGTLRFFSINGTGRILNRFSTDTGIVDTFLPKVALEMLQSFMMSVGVAFIVGYVDILLLLPAIFVFGMGFFMTNVYGYTGRNLKHLEGITRSPVYSHLNDTLRGLTTIRVSEMDKKLAKEFDSRQDIHSAASYTLLATTKAFGLWTDILIIIYIIIVTLKFLVIDQETLLGNVAVAVTQSMTMANIFQWSMSLGIETGCLMTSVERIKEYSKIELEEDNSQNLVTLPKNWPNSGKIQFQNLYLHYFPNEPPVLKDLSLTIYPREKIGIVGRTGSGKTSIINALFRLTDSKGCILIDGLNINEISLYDLRSNLSVIPQENALFSSTMRRNLDPSENFSDEELWKVLEKVDLKDVIGNLPDGLSFEVHEGGQNFSLGQRQLICLARALLYKRKILIMDESSAKLDPHTEQIIKKTIDYEFQDCTILTVAHRLGTIMDSDRVIVMDAGQIIEFNHPYKLLENKAGMFYAMVQQTGVNTGDNLHKIAERNFQKLYQDGLEIHNDTFDFSE